MKFIIISEHKMFILKLQLWYWLVFKLSCSLSPLNSLGTDWANKCKLFYINVVFLTCAIKGCPFLC